MACLFIETTNDVVMATNNTMDYRACESLRALPELPKW